MSLQTRGLITLLFAIFGLLTVGGILHSDKAQEYRGDVAYYNGRCNEERQNGSSPYLKDCQGLLFRTIDDPIALFTIVLSIATIGLFGATFYLWRATTDLVRGADETARRQLRAYIGVESADLTGFRINQPISGNLNIKNFGSTPGLHCSTRMEVAVIPFAEYENVYIVTDGMKEVTTTIWPSGIKVSRIDMRSTLTPMMMRDLSGGNKIICAIGRIDYIDVFGTKRWTTFKMGSFGPRTGFGFAPNGNDSN